MEDGFFFLTKKKLFQNMCSPCLLFSLLRWFDILGPFWLWRDCPSRSKQFLELVSTSATANQGSGMWMQSPHPNCPRSPTLTAAPVAQGQVPDMQPLRPRACWQDSTESTPPLFTLLPLKSSPPPPWETRKGFCPCVPFPIPSNPPGASLCGPPLRTGTIRSVAAVSPSVGLAISNY